MRLPRWWSFCALGALTLFAKDAKQADACFSNVEIVVRVNYSNPAAHGGLAQSWSHAEGCLGPTLLFAGGKVEKKLRPLATRSTWPCQRAWSDRLRSLVELVCLACRLVTWSPCFPLVAVT